MRLIFGIFAGVALAGCSQMDRAEPTQPVGVGVGVSTMGLSVEPTYRISDTLTARAIVARASASGSETADDITYDVDATVGGLGLMADYQPKGSPVRLSAGLWRPDISLDGRATGTIDVGANTYAAVDITTRVVPENDIAPAISVGIDQQISDRFSLSADVGAMYLGGYSVSVSDATNTVSNADLQAEASSVEQELDDYSVIPFVRIGGTYRW